MLRFKTKRFLYGILKNFYKNGCYAVTGARKIGKTILLLQLSEEPNTSYINIFEEGKNFDLKEYIEEMKSEGVKRICIDEVCKVTDDNYADFIETIKLYSSELCFIITGSVATSVRKINRLIGRGVEFKLPPIMYVERVSWLYDIYEVNADKLKNLSSVDLFMDYLKNQNYQSNAEMEEYVLDVVQDTLESYLNGSAIEDYRNIDISEVDFFNCLKYISLCQYIFRTSRGEVCKLPPLNKQIKNSDSDLLEGYRRRWGLDTKDILYVCSILYGCGLSRRVPMYRGDLISLERIQSVDNILDAFIFEYPWLSSYFFTDNIKDDVSLIAIWVESCIVLRASYIYMFYDKLRNTSDEEIDLVYSAGDDFYGLEVKNVKSTTISKVYISEQKDFADRVGLRRLDFTCKDDNESLLRIDKVVASMELEYIELCKNGDKYSKEDIRCLTNKYFN